MNENEYSEPQPTEAPSAPLEGPPARAIPKWLASVPLIAVIVWMLVPLCDFLRVSLARMFYHLELEWLEGEVANYSIRFTQHHSLTWLYPPFERGEYCPHLYPPLYQIIVSLLFEGTGTTELGWGRLVSFCATFLIMFATVLIVREGTRSWLAGFIGGLMLPMFFKPVGFWFDLYRVDSTAYAFAMWSCYYLTRRRSGGWGLTIGIVLAGAAGFTKQTALLLPLMAGVARLGLHFVEGIAPLGAGGSRLYPIRPVLKFAFLACVIVGANMIYAVSREPLSTMAFYLFKMPKSHLIYYGEVGKTQFQELWQYETYFVLLVPVAIWVAGFSRRWRNVGELLAAVLAGLCGSAVAWIVLRVWSESPMPIPPNFGGIQPGLFSAPTFKYIVGGLPGVERLSIALTVGGLGILSLRWFLHRTIQRGPFWLVALLVAQFIALTSWKKMGGYINNFMPLFVVQGVVFGFAVSWLHAGLSRRLPRAGPILAAGIVIFVLCISWYGSRLTMLVRHRELGIYRGEIAKMSQEAASEIPWWVSDGLRYNLPEVKTSDGKEVVSIPVPYGRQIPDRESEEWGRKLLAKLAELRRDGGVYLPHNNYLGYLTGSPIRPSIDAIRDVCYTGKRTPEPLLERIRAKEFHYVVEMLDPHGGWMTNEMADAIEANYDMAGELLPGMPWDACRPVTGAPVKPSLLYRAKFSASAAESTEPLQLDVKQALKQKKGGRKLPKDARGRRD